MMRHSKRFRKAMECIEDRPYAVEEAVATCLKVAGQEGTRVGFNETLDAALKLGVDPRHSDQMVRGTVLLPHGTGKHVRVAVFTKDKRQEAEMAGADIVDDGTGELLAAIKAGNIQFDCCIASPEMMPVLARVAKELGPKGLMPNPKLGTVTMDIATAVRESKGGKITFRVEKNGIVHAPLGKVSFAPQALLENFIAFLGAVIRAKPTGAKGTYLRSAVLSTTMGPSVKLDLTTAMTSTASSQ